MYRAWRHWRRRIRRAKQRNERCNQGRHHALKSSIASGGAYEMNLNGCMATSGRMAVQPKHCRATCKSSFTYFLRKQPSIALPNAKNWCETPLELEQSSLMGANGMILKRTMATPERISMVPRYGKAKCNASFVCARRKPIFVAVRSSRNQFGFSSVAHQLSIKDPGLLSSYLLDTVSSLLTEDHINRPSMMPVLPHHRSTRTVVARASNGITYPFRYPSQGEKKLRWWWRTLACIPYLMPLHIMAMYAQGAHKFIPFLVNFEVLADPFFGNQLPHSALIVYCFGIYLFVIRGKAFPHFFRFHVLMAMLLENAIQITGQVFSWMPYWRFLDAPVWTVVSCGFIFAIVLCIRSALTGIYPDIPVFSEAAFVVMDQP